jgi:hypothetical protein
MRARVIIGCCLALALLTLAIVLRRSNGHSRAYIAESLLVVRPFNNALLQRRFEREVRNSFTGIARLGFELSIYTSTTPKGTTRETNCVIRLLVAGATEAEAERRATNASSGLRAALWQRYGVRATRLDQVHSAPSSAAHEPFRFEFADTAPGPFATIGPVFFQKPHITLDPGDGWTRSYTVSGDPACDPILIGKGRFNGAFIQAYLSESRAADVQSRLGELRAWTDQQPAIIKLSRKEEPFTTESGMHGAHTSFTQQNLGPNGILMAQTTHHYVFTNAQSGWAGITYHTASGGESQEVQRMIRRSLKVY